MSSLVEFSIDMVKELYSCLDFASHLLFAGTCQKFYRLSKILLPRDDNFEKKKWEFILSRALHPRIWETEGWLTFDAFGKLYDELFYSFELTEQSINKFMRKYPKIFRVTHKHIWNLSRFGKAPDK
jgi:hypothetical protein